MKSFTSKTKSFTSKTKCFTSETKSFTSETKSCTSKIKSCTSKTKSCTSKTCNIQSTTDQFLFKSSCSCSRRCAPLSMTAAAAYDHMRQHVAAPSAFYKSMSFYLKIGWLWIECFMFLSCIFFWCATFCLLNVSCF